MDAFTYAHSNYFNESKYKFDKSNFDNTTERFKLQKKLMKTSNTTSSKWRNPKTDKNEEFSPRKSQMNSTSSLPSRNNKQFINKALYMIKRNFFTKVEKHLSTALSTKINRQKRHGIKDAATHQKVLILINNLYKIKDEVNNYMQKKDVSMAIECLLSSIIKAMLEILEFAIVTNDKFLLLHTTMEIGLIYKMFGRISDAICTFNYLVLNILHHKKLLCELLRNQAMKVKSMIQIAEIAINLQEFDSALKILKKVWEISIAYELRELEALIYEKMGIAYYYKRDLSKAKYFHNRSLNFEVEGKDSKLREICKNRLNFYNQTYPIPHFKTLNKFFLKRVLNFFPIVYSKEYSSDNNREEDQNELVELCDLQRSSNRFLSKSSADDQINFIIDDKEFENLLPTPRGSVNTNNLENQNKNTLPIEIQSENNLGKSIGSSFKTYLNIIKKKNVRGSTQNNDQFDNRKATFTSMKFEQLTSKHNSLKCSIPSIPTETMKLTLDQKIRMRIKLGNALNSSQYVSEMNTHMKRKMKSDVLNDKIHINHLTVNRNIDMFESSCNFNPKKLNGYFDKIISKQFVKSFFDNRNK